MAKIKGFVYAADADGRAMTLAPRIFARSLKKLWPNQFFKSRSKVTVTCSKFMVPPERSRPKKHACQI